MRSRTSSDAETRRCECVRKLNKTAISYVTNGEDAVVWPAIAVFGQGTTSLHRMQNQLENDSPSGVLGPAVVKVASGCPGRPIGTAYDQLALGNRMRVLPNAINLRRKML